MKFVFIVSFLFSFLFSFSSFAGPVFPDAIDPIDSLECSCKEAAECRLMSDQDLEDSQILMLADEESYVDANEIIQVAGANGYYVGIDDTFYETSEIGTTSTGEYRYCDGGGLVLEMGSSLDQIPGQEDPGLLSMLNQTCSCPTLWVPDSELGEFPGGSVDEPMGTDVVTDDSSTIFDDIIDDLVPGGSIITTEVIPTNPGSDPIFDPIIPGTGPIFPIFDPFTPTNDPFTPTIEVTQVPLSGSMCYYPIIGWAICGVYNTGEAAYKYIFDID